jgi:hypothetical protein
VQLLCVCVSQRQVVDQFLQFPHARQVVLCMCGIAPQQRITPSAARKKQGFVRPIDAQQGTLVGCTGCGFVLNMPPQQVSHRSETNNALHAAGMTNDNMPSRPQQPARRPQRLMLIVHVYKASSEDDGIGRPLGRHTKSAPAVQRTHW